jgi:hypothetical protein
MSEIEASFRKPLPLGETMLIATARVSKTRFLRIINSRGISRISAQPSPFNLSGYSSAYAESFLLAILSFCEFAFQAAYL